MLVNFVAFALLSCVACSGTLAAMLQNIPEALGRYHANLRRPLALPTTLLAMILLHRGSVSSRPLTSHLLAGPDIMEQSQAVTAVF